MRLGVRGDGQQALDSTQGMPSRESASAATMPVGPAPRISTSVWMSRLIARSPGPRVGAAGALEHEHGHRGAPHAGEDAEDEDVVHTEDACVDALVEDQPAVEGCEHTASQKPAR